MKRRGAVLVQDGVYSIRIISIMRSDADADATPIVTPDQLVDFAKLIISRLP
ncbi:MAG: hypothetical protein IH932_04690 [Thaumarchaeota archaeon]|nr:hypothetical protein [Nitrososphaerota archaeon]